MKKIYLLICSAVCSFSLSAQVLWSEDFSTAAGSTPPAGWANTDLDGGGIIWVFDNPGGRDLYSPITDPAAIFDSDFLSAEGQTEEAVLESPSFNANNAGVYFILEFDHTFAQGFEDGLYTVEVTDGANWYDVYSGVDEFEYEHVMLNITPLLGMNPAAKVRFHWTGSWDFYWIVDNVKITQVTCLYPLDAAVGNITTNSASFTWNVGDNETDWDIEYGPTGFPQGSGTSATASGIPEYTLNMLTSDTQYDVYVRSDCGGGDVSSWVGPISFWTLCDPPVISSFPWTENFDATHLPELACGWTLQDANNDTYTWFPFEGFIANSPPFSMFAAYNPDDLAEPMDDWLFTPELDLAAGTYQLKFMYAAGGEIYLENLGVHIGTNPDAMGMTAELADITAIANTDYEMATINFEIATAGSYYIGFHGHSDPDMNFLSIDDVSIDECPGCPLTIDEHTLDAIAMHPNPTKGVMHIESPEVNGEMAVAVVDFAGKEVFRLPGTQQGIFDLDLSKLESGVYFVQFRSESASLVQRVVLTK